MSARRHTAVRWLNLNAVSIFAYHDSKFWSMAVMSTTIAPPVAAHLAVSDVAVRRFGRFSLFVAGYTYLLVLFGGIVRITQSGMGCGDDWPKCNGQWIPQFTLPTLIEYTHRLLGVTIGLVAIGLAFYAYRHRRHARFGGRNGLARPAYVALAGIVVQGLLGAITVRLELSTAVTAIHFMTALLILALFLAAAARAGTLGSAEPVHPSAANLLKRHARAAMAAAVLAFIAITFGAITANTPGAPQACQGFPLCNGQLLPAPVPQIHIHWTHRLLAFLLLLHVFGTTIRAANLPARVRNAALTAMLVVAAQIGVAFALVLFRLPRELQVIHLAAGAAVWATIIAWVFVARAATAQALRT
jgi:heme a synthase